MTERTAVLWTMTVLVGLAALLIPGCERTSQSAKKTPAEAASQTAGTGANEAAASAQPEPNQDDSQIAQPEATSETRVVAYYFHRTIRCPTCLSIERQSREAMETGYGDELKSGQLEWHAVDIEAPGNQHFEADFEFESSSLVLVETAGDEVVRWKNLTRVWELVDDSLGFQEYVWIEVAEFLGT